MSWVNHTKKINKASLTPNVIHGDATVSDGLPGSAAD